MVVSRRSRSRKKSNAERRFRIPADVRRVAREAIKLRNAGFQGTLETGRKRADQLAKAIYISHHDARMIKAWFARHRAQSMPIYEEWIRAGKPMTAEFKKKRSILAIMSWSGPEGERWVNSLDLD